MRHNRRDDGITTIPAPAPERLHLEDQRLKLQWEKVVMSDKREWNKPEDKLPEDSERVLVARLGAEFDHVSVAKFESEDCIFVDDDGCCITTPDYWASLQPMLVSLPTKIDTKLLIEVEEGSEQATRT